MSDLYYSIASSVSDIIYKEKGSKFIGYAYPVSSEEDIELALANVKQKQHKARHFCYAWQLEKDYSRFRANDDGEPSNSAGMPIFGQLQAFNLTNCLVVVVRYFGGTKLGVGGLISAYKTTAQQTLQQAKITKHTIDEQFKIQCNYDLINVVMRYIEEDNLQLIHQNLEMNCNFTLGVRKKEFNRVLQKFQKVYGLDVKHPSLEKEG
ncbi:IMPACT family protein [Psychroflexus salis]|uniref:Impact N-terminal domain-containing protein n=1 Tax=Psychroflexus salis TaxID=1526574 RepID=A0A917A1F6_9FLAO|nr:YigZ family protein [Psychroflexus salis]GGE20175.1 hypothetical protein GCM10010831_21620 [Psychroflexus salis]